MVQLSVEKNGFVALVRFNNPPHGYMDGQTEIELEAFLDEVEENDDIRSVVFTGGLVDVFIRHYDVSLLYKRSQSMTEKGMTFDPARPVPEAILHRCFRRMEEMPKAFIAAINGSAMGGGFELALACDIRLVKEGAYDLGLPEINLGILPGAGGTQRLPRLIGESRALALTLLGRTMSPREAKDIGLAAYCVEGDVVAKAMEIAQALASRSPRAFSHIKKLVRGAASNSRAEGLAEERTLFCDLMVDPRALLEMADMDAEKRDIRDPNFTASAPSK
ncbi:enoyl-CoA hydratase/isomerase family protein [Sneathiella marina]|uniref:Enoyl-CoA hydratase/isomerase family protein n=1 Tax=Sneathiella marina TaxID=2950108 RepID=A0ABY4W588_9PROT|nr:enoyl-CoA hydratase/isomerase family protein [Sneathiella marina]USG60880.1 enoyl-CoA hydratase/isomerase family protein [Sneathiella marina]